MRTTPFIDVYIALGAKMHEFAGLNMPIEYPKIIDEYMTVVNGVGVFDVPHMGEFWVKGPNALVLIQSITSNDVSVLLLDKAQYTCFPNDKGGTVDDPLVYHYEPEKYLLVVNAGNIDRGWDWCVSHNTVDAELENSSDHTTQLAVQGPKAQEILQRLTPADSSSTPYYLFVMGEFAGCKNVIISNTGYTGVGGFELYFYPSDTTTIQNAIFEAGRPEGVRPIGLGVRDTLHLEMGFCLHGNDLDDTISPIKVGLGWITELAEGKNLTNRAGLEHQKKEGVTRKLCVFELQGKGTPCHGYEIVDAEENVIGVVTPGTMSPVLKGGVSMGHVKPGFAEAGMNTSIRMHNKSLRAQAVRAPFHK